MRTRSPIFNPRSSSAFTIVELMISIAMVVILMVGIHQVFKMTSDTVGMGQQLGDFARANRSVQGVFSADFERMMKNAPLFYIRSGVASTPTSWGAFTTEAERSSDRDAGTNPDAPLTQDFNSNGTEGDANVIGEITSLAQYNSRNHRVDVIGFPANGLFRRHTANDGSYSSNTTSQDAFIFYGHVNLPTFTGGTPPVVYFQPGDPAAGNVNNSLASQWILGRVALLMRDLTGGEAHIARNFPARPLSPLRWDSLSSDTPTRFLQDSRYDLVNASLEQVRQDVADIRANVGATNFEWPRSTWWQPLVYTLTVAANPGPPGDGTIPLTDPVSRFNCNPRIAKPITSESMAKAMPVLLNNCSQFAVEYAGDFLTQNNNQYVYNNATPPTLVYNPDWGTVTALEPDGVIDYVVDHSKVTNTDYNVAARTRWYGLPRDTNDDGIISGFANNPSYQRARYDTSVQYTNFSSGNELVDVVPLRDVVATIRDPSNGNGQLYPNFFGAAFERELPFYAPGGEYMSGLANAPANVKNAFRYTCVWVNSSPKMIRIALKLEDPAGRLPEGQWYEYVVGAP